MMSNKTTKEEREKVIKEALESEDEDTKEVESIIENFESQEDPEDQENDDNNPDPEDIENPQEDEEKNKLPDVEDRYKQSTKEAQVLYAKQKKFTDTVEKAVQLPEPTDAELKSAYPTWEDMTETERFLARDNYINKQKFDIVYQATQEGKEIDEWVEKVDSFIINTSSKYPKLQGRESEFRNFALKPTRRGIDPDSLIKIFLYDIQEAPTNPKRGSLLESRSSGKPTTQKKTYLGEREASLLRKNNHKLYQKYIKEGKIKIEL